MDMDRDEFEVIDSGNWEGGGEITDYASAVFEADRIADELERIGFTTDRSWASRDNLFCIHAIRGDEVRNIEVIRADN